MTQQRPFKPAQNLESFIIHLFERKVRELEEHRLKLKIPGIQPERKMWKEYQSHFEPEIFIQVHGTTEFFFTDEKFNLGPGEICIVPPFTSHAEKARDGEAPFSNLVFSFSSQIISFHSAIRIGIRPQAVPPPYMKTNSEAAKIALYISEIINLHRANDPKLKRSIDALMMLFLERTIYCLQQPQLEQEKENTLVEKCKSLVHSKLASQNLSVARLASWLGCSANYLSWIYSRTEKGTLSSYISNARLVQVKRLLKTTNMNVKQIALACGFEDPAYCIRVFKKKFGVTPKRSRTKA